MASQHIRPTTNTRLAGELNAIVANIRAVDASLPQLKEIMDQIASASDFGSLGEEFGYVVIVDPVTGDKSSPEAETAYNLIGSLVVELASAAFWNQVIGRMG